MVHLLFCVLFQCLSLQALAVAVSPDASLIATTSKDATCRIWSTCTQSNDQKMRCVAICRGHTAAVGGVAFPNNANVSLRASGPAFIATVSADMSTKLWDLRPVLLKLSTKRPSTSQVRQGKINQLQVSSEEPIELNVLYSVAAHKKDINAISIAPNDQVSSNDKIKCCGPSNVAFPTQRHLLFEAIMTMFVTMLFYYGCPSCWPQHRRTSLSPYGRYTLALVMM